MPKCRFTKRAIEDLADIWRYTAKQWSVNQADLYYHLRMDLKRRLIGK